MGARDRVQKDALARRLAEQKVAAGAISQAEGSAAFARAESDLASSQVEEKHQCEEFEAATDLLHQVLAHRAILERDQEKCKRQIDEGKKAQPGAKDAVKAAVRAEKDAAQEKQALHNACSKVAKQQDQMETAKNSALHKLMSEDYDAQQVEKAYQATKSV